MQYFHPHLEAHMQTYTDMLSSFLPISSLLCAAIHTTQHTHTHTHSFLADAVGDRLVYVSKGVCSGCCVCVCVCARARVCECVCLRAHMHESGDKEVTVRSSYLGNQLLPGSVVCLARASTQLFPERLTHCFCILT